MTGDRTLYKFTKQFIHGYRMSCTTFKEGQEPGRKDFVFPGILDEENIKSVLSVEAEEALKTHLERRVYELLSRYKDETEIIIKNSF